MSAIGILLRLFAIALLIVLVVVIVQHARAGGLLYPYDPWVVNPDDDKKVAATLADPHIPLDIKKQLYRLWDLRHWPQEIVDPRDGSVWIYETGKPPRSE